MSTSYPPRLASTLMRWMGPRDEALIGDLFEAYQIRRSDSWYWRQVLAAIPIGVVTAARSHKLLALRAIVLGWLVVYVYANYVGSSVYLAARTAFNFRQLLFVTGLTDWFWVHHIDFPATVLRAGPDIVTAWVGMFASGWLVGYFHRSHGASMVLVFCATLPLPMASQILWQVATDGSHRGPVLLMLAAFMFPLAYLPALAGGLWATRPGNDAAPLGPMRRAER